MGFLSRVESYLKHFDRFDDKVVKILYDEYYTLLRFSLYYPKLKSYHIIVHFIQFLLFAYLLVTNGIIVIITVVFSFNDFPIMVNSVHITFLLYLHILLIIQFTFQRTELATGHKIIAEGVFNYDGPVTVEENLLKVKYFKIKRILKIVSPLTNILAAITVFFVAPWIDREKSDVIIYDANGVNFVIPIPVWFPFEAHEGFLFVYASFSEIACGVVLNLSLASLSWIFFTMIIHLIFQMERLILSVKNIQFRALEMYEHKNPEPQRRKYNATDLAKNEEFMRCMEHCLKQNIQHHQQILKLRTSINNLMRVPLFATFFAAGAVIGFSALIIFVANGKQGLVLGTLTLLILELGHTIGVCAAGQKLSDLNEELHFQLYNTSWHNCSKKFKTNLLITQSITSRALDLNTMFNFKVNMDTSCQILNTAYSYFNILLVFKSS